MAQFRIPNRDQLLMLETVDLNSIAPVGSAVYTIDKIVNSLDTSDIENKYDIKDPMGRPPFHPKTLIKVGLYALHNCRFSTRKMEQDTRYNLCYKYLTGNEVIDHTTFAKFFTNYTDYVTELFSQTALICKEENLIGFEILGIDTEKVKADASYKQTKSLDNIQKDIDKIKKNLKKLLEKADEVDEAETKALEKRLDKIKSAEKILKERLNEKCKDKKEPEIKEILKKTKVNITDPDGSVMSQANGEHNVMYAVTTTTDTKDDIITGFVVKGEANDNAVLFEAIEESEANIGSGHEHIVADSGFGSYENFEEGKRRELDLLIPDKRKEVEEKGKTSKGEYDRSHFEYNKEKDNYRCPTSNILEMEREIIGRDGREKIIYSNDSACGRCKVKNLCTKSENGGRKIIRDANEEIKDEMRKKLNSEEGKENYVKRAHSAESPYGDMKHNKKFRGFMRRGIAKVSMECSLIFMLHNILKLSEVLLKSTLFG